MNGSKYNVLLYSDESLPAFFAVVSAAILMMNMPSMHLTIVQLKESNDGYKQVKKNGINSCPISPTPDWMKDVMGYDEICAKINEIFSKRVEDVSHHVIYCNPNIPDAVDTLLEYAAKKSIELIVMGTEAQTTLKGLIFGSLAHTLQNRSPIPVLLVNKLPQDFIDSYRSKPTLRVIQK